ncbi:phosphonate monoester hydrolase [Marinobacterium nitratireducens]|uniref:Phosphonate monoester hydrolase n=2 Tax=Marinobacterium nitratireducens TaxID=518897 RepID=A0A917ZB60_9GAMM|nr:phosphonate monoester hydrolase [Marinobacterium nitratireducens]
MCDQLRQDYLSCYGHETLKTPNIDALANMGVTFDNAFIQSPLCGPSRASFYTGRYMFSHGSNWNNFPLRVDEKTIGDYLSNFNVRTALVGKTHMLVDPKEIQRLKIFSDAELGIHLRECGFEPYTRDDGLHPDPIVDPDLEYNKYLSSKGYNDSHNPWNYAANAIEVEGKISSGWLMRHCSKPARVADEHSETAYMTDKAIEFINDAGKNSWCLHLSYIKPHWPYIVSSPYHDMYSKEDIKPVVRSSAELTDAHPVHKGFMDVSYSKVFSDDKVRDTVIPAYMGLIKQVDDHFGRLMRFLSENEYLENTLIVFTSDHGDYLGDHWLGEKDLYHNPSIKIPLIIYDPCREADGTRGSRNASLVESIDLLPTFIRFHSQESMPYRLEGTSLLDTLRTGKELSRKGAITELDYSCREEARRALEIEPEQCRGFVYTTKCWKYVMLEGYDAVLFNLIDDPDELINVVDDPNNRDIVQECREGIFEWLRKRRTRNQSEEEIKSLPRDFEKRAGIMIGVW